jgi:hypothetical protein
MAVNQYGETINEEGEIYGVYGQSPPNKKYQGTTVAGRDFSGDWSTSRPSSYGSNMNARPGTYGSQTQRKVGPAEQFNIPDFKVPTLDEPEYGELPTFEAPQYDRGEISKRAQKYAAPGVRKLRRAVQTATSRGFENPNVRRMTLRDALAGYGEGLENVMSGAQKTAASEYAQEYAYKYKEAGMNYQSAVQAVRDKYQGKMQSRGLQFRAEMAAVENVYRAQIEAERYRVAEANKRNDFNNLYSSYRKGILN